MQKETCNFQEVIFLGFITESAGNQNTATLIQLQSAQLKYSYEVQQPLLIQIAQQQQMILEELKKLNKD